MPSSNSALTSATQKTWLHGFKIEDSDTLEPLNVRIFSNEELHLDDLPAYLRIHMTAIWRSKGLSMTYGIYPPRDPKDGD